MSNPSEQLRRRIKLVTWLFILGLVISGATAIPLQTELEWLGNFFGNHADSAAAHWFSKVKTALNESAAKYPFLFYGMDWLAFGHFVIAISFIGALRDPVRSIWLFNFGLLACALVIPFALIFGALRGIPFWWRLIDCSFGVFGAIPLWLCRKWTRELEELQEAEKAIASARLHQH